MNYELTLKQYFGFDTFRGIQKDIVESIGSGHDTLGLMPTGGGKSITFQVPAMTMEGVCIVITPLIALMQDQVEHLRKKGIRAACVHSAISRSEILQIFDNAIFGGLDFLYISPERIATPLFQLKVQQMKVCFITVDEAHCISQWGYDFRPSYLQIAKIRELIPDVAILALTATATPDVVEDIQNKLQFREHRVFRMSFKRDNLVYVTRRIIDKERELVHILQSVKGSAIVYSRSREGTKTIARMLQAQGISAAFYHAGLDTAVKNQRQYEWQENAVRVMVATNAFGMGIDKPDVRLVVHMDCPDSIEAYFQEAGRGGRDGKLSYAVMLYNDSDISKLRRSVVSAFPPLEYVRKVYDHLAYFFQLAVNSGEGAVYEFDLSVFSVKFKHFPANVESALTILERAGYICYNPDPDNHPRVQFLLSRDSLYNIETMSRIEDMVINTLLRYYTGLFSTLTYIEEGFISSCTGLSDEQVHITLRDLGRRGIIKYIPRRDIPRIMYPQQRIESDRLRFPAAIYEDLRERAEKRAEAVISFLERNDECRQVILLDYFGEKSEPCNKCDACLANRGEEVKKDNIPTTKELIIEHLKANNNVFVSSLMDIKIPRAELLKAIEELREEGIIRMDGSKVFIP